MRRLSLSVLRKLKRMGWRLAGILLVISLAMGMTVTGFYSADVFEYSVQTYFEDGRMPDVFVTLEAPANASEVGAAIAGIPGIGAFDMRLRAGGLYSDEKGDVPVLLLGVSDPARRDIGILALEAGEYFDAPGEAVAIYGLEGRGVETGGVLGVMVGSQKVNLTLTGTVSTPEYMIPNSMAEYGLPMGGSLIVVYMDLAELQSLAGPGVNDIVVVLGGASADVVSAALAPFGVRGFVLQSQHPTAKFMRIGSAKMDNMMPIIGSFFMLIGFISIFMTVYRLVRNDSRYIGVLMSMGYTKGEVVRGYMLLGVAIAALGAVIGTAMSIAMSYGIVQVSLTYYSQLKIAFPVDVPPFLYGLLFVVSSVMLSVYIPVMMVARKTVREALDYKPSSKVKAVRASPRGLSRTTLMGLRNSVRNPGRTALTVIVVAMTIGVSGSFLVMTDSAYTYMFDMLASDRWDIRADFSSPQNATLLDAGALGLGASNVSWVLPFTHGTGSATAGGESTSCIVIGCDDWPRARRFEVQDGTPDFSEGVVTNIIAKDLDVGVGDRVRLDIGGRSVEVRVSAVVLDSFAGVVYLDRPTLAPIMPLGNCTGAFIKLVDSSIGNADESARTVRGTGYVGNVVVQKHISDQLDSILTQATSMLQAFFVISLAIAFVVAASAVIISTMERDVEFATLDTLGVRRWRVWSALVIEMAVLAVASAAVGVPFAYLFGWILVKIMSEVLFYFPIIFVVGSSLMTFLIGMLFILLSSVVPIRYAESVDTEKTIRERTAG